MKQSKQFAFKHLGLHLNELNDLADSVARLLHIDRSIHTLWVSIVKNKLLLMTDDSSFATQLRFQQDVIRLHLNQKLLIKLKSVKIKIITIKHHSKEEAKDKFFQITPQTASILSCIADDIEDVEIRESLKKLLPKGL